MVNSILYREIKLFFTRPAHEPFLIVEFQRLDYTVHRV